MPISEPFGDCDACWPLRIRPRAAGYSFEHLPLMKPTEVPSPGGNGGQRQSPTLIEVHIELTEGTLTHRTVIWAAGMEVFRDHPFLGVGAGAYSPATVKIVNIPLIAHNTFVSVLVELGVFGPPMLLMLLASMF
jgi:hypothetical protein